MKLITEIENHKNIPQYNVDGIIFSYIKFSTISNRNFNINEIYEIVNESHKHSKFAILKVDKIFDEEELGELYNFLDEMIKINVDYFMFSDMAVLNHFSKHNKYDKLIYAAKTLNCSYNDAKFYQDLGIKVILSNELTLDDIQTITKLDNIVIDGYGFSSIFYSKRQLLSLYKEYSKTEKEIHDKLLGIKEEKRELEYPIFENDSGTFIFTAHKYAIYKELESLSNALMFKIESLFIKEETLFEIIEIYRKAINEGIREEDFDRLFAIDNNIHDSFLYKKPSILKGDQ